MSVIQFKRVKLSWTHKKLFTPLASWPFESLSCKVCVPRYLLVVPKMFCWWVWNGEFWSKTSFLKFQKLKGIGSILISLGNFVLEVFPDFYFICPSSRQYIHNKDDQNKETTKRSPQKIWCFNVFFLYECPYLHISISWGVSCMRDTYELQLVWFFLNS